MRGNISPAFDLSLCKSDYVTIAFEDLLNTIQCMSEGGSAAVRVAELSWFLLLYITWSFQLP